MLLLLMAVVSLVFYAVQERQKRVQLEAEKAYLEQQIQIQHRRYAQIIQRFSSQSRPAPGPPDE